MSDEQDQGQKIGAGHMAAMGRAGLKELSQALPAFPSAGIQPVEETGLAGNLSPQEVVQGKGQDYDAMLSNIAQQAPQQEADQQQER